MHGSRAGPVGRAGEGVESDGGTIQDRGIFMQRSMTTTEKHPAFFSLSSLALIAPLCIVGAIIGTQLIVTLGITTNTSL